MSIGSQKARIKSERGFVKAIDGTTFSTSPEGEVWGAVEATGLLLKLRKDHPEETFTIVVE